MLEHQRFVSFLVVVSSMETIFCALTFVEVPPQLRKAQQTIPRLVPHFSHRFSLRKGRLSTQQQITGSAKTRSLSRKSPVSFFRISFSYNVFVLFLFSLKSNNPPFCYHGNCSSQMKVVPFVRAYSYSGL